MVQATRGEGGRLGGFTQGRLGRRGGWGRGEGCGRRRDGCVLLLAKQALEGRIAGGCRRRRDGCVLLHGARISGSPLQARGAVWRTPWRRLENSVFLPQTVEAPYVDVWTLPCLNQTRAPKSRSGRSSHSKGVVDAVPAQRRNDGLYVWKLYVSETSTARGMAAAAAGVPGGLRRRHGRRA